MKARSATAAAIAACVVASAWLAAAAPLGLDYSHDAGPPIDALVDGDLERFFRVQALMGSFSMLLRAPFAALSGIAGGGDLPVYRLGAFPCLLAVGLVGVWLARLMRGRDRPWLACGLAGGVCLLNPMTLEALRWGHPEELLGAALCVGSALAALGRRSLAAGVLLGLALATKQWALIAAAPVLLAAARPERVRVALVALAVACVLTLPLLAGSLDTFVDTNVEAARTPGAVSPASIWWPVASERHQRVFDGVGQADVTSRFLPGVLASLPHVLIVALALALSALFWRARGGGRPEDALALLALLLLLRAVLDPVNIGYYHVPFLVSLAAWEGLRGRGWPVLTVGAAGALWLTFEGVEPLLRPALTNAVYLAWTLPLAALLSLAAFAPRALGWTPRRPQVAA